MLLWNSSNNSEHLITVISRFYSSIAHDPNEKKHSRGYGYIIYNLSHWNKKQLFGSRESVIWTVFYFFKAKNKYSRQYCTFKVKCTSSFRLIRSEMFSRAEGCFGSFQKNEQDRRLYLLIRNEGRWGWPGIFHFNLRFHFLHGYFSIYSSTGKCVVLLNHIYSKNKENCSSLSISDMKKPLGAPALDHFRN